VDDEAAMKRFLVPEVIQTSVMDCGPASLKALFAGFGLYLSYGRLREACQTDVDGTSIDTLEAMAQALGLNASQVVIPADLVLLPTSASLPAIVVMRLAGGATHFVVLWSVHGPLVQIMDPGAGRIWMHRQRFLDSLYIHEQMVTREMWDEWSQTEVFTASLESRMRALGVEPHFWNDRMGNERMGKDRAHLDAALRLAQTLCDAGKLTRGAEGEQFLSLCAHDPEQIPPEFWTIRKTTDGDDRLRMRGAVLVVAAGKREEASTEPLSQSLEAVRNEPPTRVWLPVWEAIRESGWLSTGLIVLALLASAAGTVFEPLLFRGFFDLARHLKLSGQRIGAIVAMICFLGGLLALEWPAVTGLLRLGRHLEMRLRTRILMKIPRLYDRHFQSRLVSDMAFRAHTLQLLRQLPELAGLFLRSTASLIFAAAGIAWFYPGAALPAVLAVIVAVGVPLLFQPALASRDLRFREFSGALSRFYLDALLGLRPIQAHGAARTLRTLHSEQLGQWAEAGLRLQSVFVRAEVLQMAVTYVPVIALVYREALRTSSPAGLLLLAYWAVSIPTLGQELASIAWDIPALRNTLWRLLEPLGAPEEQVSEAAPIAKNGGVALEIEKVTVVAGGHVILEDVDLSVAPGEHIAVVGLSGAGKSSLASLLLGWHKPQRGSVTVDGAPLDGEQLAQLRRHTAWIAPEVHLFQASLLDNLNYGNGSDCTGRVGLAIQGADLLSVLERLPDGLQTELGESGALVSGGEGQNVRIGRAMARPDVRLAILDEPARGLDREARRSLLARARQHFAKATMIFVTHDVPDTLDFQRVLVVEQGRIIEQGSPRELYEKTDSRYRTLCDQEKNTHNHLFSDSMWRHLKMSSGVLSETKEACEWTAA
jgi:ABC-type bacteriocin/lantibiotic exporter with double-glycine peptidase domain